MTPARLQTIEEIFHAALDQEPDQIDRFVNTACEGDELLRRKVEALLASHQRAGSFIEIPAAGIVTRIIENGQADLLVGQTIGHYKISKRIGSGGMGEVYLASDITAGRNAALKVLPMRFTGDVERLRRFQQEARAVVGLNHPNILTVYEIGEYDSSHYIASELIEGETLRQRLARGRMGLDEAINVAIQVATALAAAHQAGIVHRDIKPENIMLRPDGYVKVLDFGIAKLAEQEVPVTMAEEAVSWIETNLGAILGTVRYMSPEQARGAPVDQCSDIWSLGVVIYEMAAGRAPFTGDTPGEVMASILGTEALPLTSSIAQTPAELQKIVSKALSKEREKRYQSAHEMLEALKSLRRGMEFKAELERSTAAPSWLRWTRSPTAPVLVLLVAALAVALPFYWQRKPTTGSIPEKSIAVLPFENISDNKDNSDFAAGIQDDVLTSLAQIHELKVISRTSVMAYQKAGGRNIREIAQALGVANVLEGSVRRAGNRVLVNVQLIDARNDRHVWAERYDRTVADSIGLQGELATQIAAALKATLAPDEKARLGAEPTANSEAYVLYLTALGKEGTDWEAAEQLHVQAAAIDPKFALAYAHASILNNWFFPERNAKARAQAEEALRLSPKLGEGHVALGLCLYVGEKKYDAALNEFEIAAATSPNNAQIYKYVGGIYRRQGRWRDAVAGFDRAISLDPLNPDITQFAANNHLYLRDWAAAAAGCTRTLEIKPESIGARSALAYLEVFRNGNPAAGAKLLQNIPSGRDPYNRAALTRWDLAMLERDYAAAERLSSDLPELPPERIGFPKSFYHARTALARGDMEAARRYFAATTPVLEARVRDHPDDADGHSWLGILYGYMRRKEDAIRESRRAVELEPESRDAFHGAIYSASLALVYALVGEEDAAMTLIERLLSTPGAVSYPDYPYSMTLADLRLRWEWDSLRSNPHFQKILAGPEPKTVLAASQQVAPAAPEKSIAVLPFENLSDEKENSYFAAGVQDEILSNLAMIADLKVISRASANLYKSGNPRNSREIGRQLGVAYLLEGSVQRAGHRLRVNTQLVDARTDAHLWAQTYDRDVADVFAIQSEIAKTIADQLRTKISPTEQVAITQPPTADLVANDLYLQALDLEFKPPQPQDYYPEAVRLLEQAVARDPQFVRAYCKLAGVHLVIYFGGQDHTPARRDLAKAAIENAARLQPDAGEVHLARARYFYHGFLDYDRARGELDLARRTFPNDPTIYFLSGAIDRRQGRFAAAVKNYERAVELDPRNREFLITAAVTYHSLHRYSEESRLVEREVNISPRDYWARLGRASRPLNERADTRPLHRELDAICAEQPEAAREISSDIFLCAMLERDSTAATRALAVMPPEGTGTDTNFNFPREWFAGLAARTFNDPEGARTAFTAARGIAEKMVRDQPDYAPAWSLLGRIDAALGRKEDAIKEGLRACELLPISKDAWAGPYYVKDLALIYAWTGENDLAFEQLALLAPKGLHYGELKLDPNWDALRTDPRFERLLASYAAKD